MTSNNLQCEIDFHAEGKSQTIKQLHLLSANKVFV